jgi:hypothetical protein
MKLDNKQPAAYTAFSKHNFFAKQQISAFVLEKDYVPLNPFMNWDYFLNDLVERNLIVRGNNNLIMLADELWTFGQISNGVYHEIILAKKLGKKIKYFSSGKKVSDIKPIKFSELEYEKELLDEFPLEEIRNRLK